MHFEAIKFIVPGYCAEGLNLLAARAKMGKSWLALNWLLACSVSGIAMGTMPVDIGDCLYLALEDGPRRLQSRIRQLIRDDRDRKSLNRLTLWTSAPRLDQGPLKELSSWAESVMDPRLIVIDVFAKVRPAGRNGENAYDADYRALSPLQEWATKRRIAVVLLHQASVRSPRLKRPRCKSSPPSSVVTEPSLVQPAPSSRDTSSREDLNRTPSTWIPFSWPWAISRPTTGKLLNVPYIGSDINEWSSLPSRWGTPIAFASILEGLGVPAASVPSGFSQANDATKSLNSSDGLQVADESPRK